MERAPLVKVDPDPFRFELSEINFLRNEHCGLEGKIPMVIVPGRDDFAAFDENRTQGIRHVALRRSVDTVSQVGLVLAHC